MNKSIKILVAHHKQGLIIKSDEYLPIHVGKSLHKDLDLGIQGDNDGENISDENPIYCEMTAWYWAWKNLKADYIGLCHYRRYFTFDKPSIYRLLRQNIRYWYFRCLGNIIKPGNTCTLTSMLKINDINIFDKNANIFSKKICMILQKEHFDVVAPIPHRWSGRNNEQYFSALGMEHFQLLSAIVKNISPDYYEEYSRTMTENYIYAANMAIFSYNMFIEYCNFIFPILELHKEQTIKKQWCNDLIKEKAYSRRLGYFAEILTSTFISKKIREKKKCLFVNTMFLNND